MKSSVEAAVNEFYAPKTRTRYFSRRVFSLNWVNFVDSDSHYHDLGSTIMTIKSSKATLKQVRLSNVWSDLLGSLIQATSQTDLELIKVKAVNCRVTNALRAGGTISGVNSKVTITSSTFERQVNLRGSGACINLISTD